MQTILRVRLKYEQDISLVRQRTQKIASLAGFSSYDQTRLTTAVSEVARNAFQYAGEGVVELGVIESHEGAYLQAIIQDQGSGIENLEAVVTGRFHLQTGLGMGLASARKLVDRFEIDSQPGQGTTVTLARLIPAQTGPVTPELIASWTETIVAEAPGTLLQEFQRQNQELLGLMADLQEKEDALARQLEQIKALEQARDELTHAMVHDLRNPLSTIVISLGGVLEDEDEELSAHQREMLKIAHLSARGMMKLVNNILDVSRLENNQLTLQYKRVSVTELIVEALRGQAFLAEMKQVTLEREIAPNLPSLRADPDLLSRVLQNLLDNALKFTPVGGVIRVTAQAWPATEPAGVEIAVSDTGSGIPPEEQGSLFEKFAIGSKSKSGSGLGLAFCKLALEAHQGRIWIESAPGAGTTIIFSLPAEPRTDQPATS